jgi:hypothetical protein
VGALENLDFRFEFTDPSMRLAKLLRFLGRAPRNLSAVDAVLFDPGVDGGLRDVEINRRLGD